MRKQLLIKGQEMDLLGNTYAMEWVSPLFQNLGDIKENRSTTIKLSKTNHNLAILGNFNVINVNSNTPYSFIEAEYRINGVPIISNAKMYVLTVGNYYIDVCLLWNFNKWVVESLKKKLTELSPDMTTIQYDSNIIPGVLTDAMIGLPIAQPNPLDYKAHNLFVKEHGLVDFIFRWEFGELFTHVSEPDNGNMIELPTRKVIGSKTVIKGYFNRKSNKLYEHNIRASSSSVTGNKRFEVINNIDRLLFPLQSARYNFDIKFSNEEDVNYITSVDMIVWYKPEGRPEYPRYIPHGKNLVFNELLRYDGTTGNYGNYEVTIAFPYWYTPISTECTITITQDNEELSIGDYYPISINLPEMTISEYLKDYFVRENKFLYFKDQNNTYPYPVIGNFKDVFESQIVDWSEKLLSQDTMSFKPDDMAQKNIYKYKENDEVEYKSDGSINISNESMDKESIIYESKFSPAPEDADGTVIIPHFDEKGEYYDSKLNYIVNLRSKSLLNIPDGRKSASFTQGDNPLPFDNILSTHYTDYSQIFINYKEITVKVLLNTVDILSLDFKKRYYFSQFSSYFLIKKCSVIDEIATLTMIKL